jgi:hypothetical protein
MASSSTQVPALLLGCALQGLDRLVSFALVAAAVAAALGAAMTLVVVVVVAQ